MSLIESKAESDFASPRYLVVDDFENFRLSMRQMLIGLGARDIEMAASGSEALRRCAEESFDVILCDFNLGEGKSGQEVLEELRYRKLLPSTALFVIVTAETSRDMVMGAREFKPDDYLTKPINRSVLKQRLGALLEQRKATHLINQAIDDGNQEKAIAACKVLLSSAPRYRSWILKNLAELYRDTGDLESAIQVYNEVLEERQQPWAQLGLGQTLAGQGDIEGAIQTLQTLVDEHKDLVEGYDALAELQRHTGKLVEAKKSLQAATKISPNRLSRQKNLAETAGQGNDLETAVEAWRQTVRLGQRSVHDSAENYLQFGRALAEISEGDSTDSGKDLAKEALQAMQQMDKRFRKDGDLTPRRNLLEARIHAGQGEKKAALAALLAASDAIDQDTMDSGTGLDMAKALFMTDQKEQAEACLKKLAERFGDETAIMSRIESLMDEPVSRNSKMKAQGLNRAGIKAFDEGDLEGAVSAFRDALAIVPKHAALNLNLVQVRMRQLENQSHAKGRVVDECRRCLEALSHLPPQHRQYKRYMALKRKLDTINGQ